MDTTSPATPGAPPLGMPVGTAVGTASDALPVAQEALPACTLLPARAIPEFDEMASLTCRVLGVPTATVTLVDTQRQVWPGAQGLRPDLEAARSTPLTHSFCQFVVASAEPLVVADAREDPRLAGSPAITENQVIAYAGMPLRDLAGNVVGSLCAIDREPVAWTSEQVETLRQLALVCSAQLQLAEAMARSAVLAERDRVALELHEKVARALIGVTMMLGSARSQASGQMVSLVDDAIAGLDLALTNLRTSLYARPSGPGR